MKRGTKKPGVRDHSRHINTVFSCQNHACNTLASNAVPPNPTKSRSKNKPPFPRLRFLRLLLLNSSESAFICVHLRSSAVKKEGRLPFQKATPWSIPNRGRELARIKRNIHLTVKNFSSCKTCMIPMKRFQRTAGWHRRCLNAARTREMRFPVTEPEQPYEENRSDY